MGSHLIKEKIIMITNMIQSVTLMNLMFIQSHAFSTSFLDRTSFQNKKLKCGTKLFGISSDTSSSNRAASSMDSNYRSKKIKTRGDESKLYYKNDRTDFWIEDDTSEVTMKEDYSIIPTESLSSHPDITNFADVQNNILQMNLLAREGKLLVEKIRNAASLIDDEELYCFINDIDTEMECKHQYEQQIMKEKYEVSLQLAKDADLKYGLCSEESLNAWDVVDEIYIKYENYDKDNEDDDDDEIDILKICDSLESTFLELQNKLN